METGGGFGQKGRRVNEGNENAEQRHKHYGRGFRMEFKTYHK